MTWSETTTAEYALGQCADPTITPTDGSVFGSSHYQVSIAKNGEKGVLRYTTGGSDPTEASPVYSSPFVISEPTDGKVRLTAGPKGNADPGMFFMRVRMTP